ncbi:MAG TPA: MerR family transcriptional regulator [Frankiaceae bacterium]|nr:MerR family transcriptional regulator [Frankiaceae bacterium]
MGIVEREAASARDLLSRVEEIEEVARTLDANDERRQQLEEVVVRILRAAPPLRAGVAAQLLSLSERTVRAWAAEGVLRAADSTSTRLLLDPERFHEVLHLVRDLREAGKTTGLLDEVYRRLVDATWLERSDLTESLAQMRRREGRVPRPKAAG